jgi:tetratricopeptide (TPR) repeat protein
MTRTPPVTDELIPMTGVSPHAALAAARSLLAARPSPRDASIAHQAAAIVLRDFGDVTAAIREFRLAARLARAAADPEREADVLTSLGTALVMAGRTRAGLAALDEASTQAASTQSASTQAASTGAGAALGRVLVRRGASLHIAGRYDQARADLRQAIMLTRRTGEVVWEARARTAAALADLATGATARAEAGFTAAEALFAGTGQQLEIAYARHNRALVAFAGGDLPAALRHLDDAAARYAGLGVEVPDAALDRCAVLLAAGLTADALAAAETALGGPATPAKKAELLLAAARTALAAGQYRISAERADRARRMFRLQHRERWRTHAALVVLQARFLAGRPPGPLLPPARRTAARLAELRSDEAPDAWLLAGRIALAAASRPSPGRRVRPGGAARRQAEAARRQAEADRLLAAAALAARRRLPAFARATGWLAEALRAEALLVGQGEGGDQRRLLAACRRGFGLLEEHLATLGAAELRAHATAHGAELAGLAQRAALRSGRPRLLLAWSERWRAVALGSLVHPAAVAPNNPTNPINLTGPADPVDHDDRAALRDVSVRLERAEPGGFPAAVLQRERLRLEAAIRGRALRAHPAGTAVATPFDAGVLLDALGPARLLELVVVDGDLHVLVCGGGRVRRLAAGTVAEAAREVDFARFGLSRIARGRLAEPAGRALAVLAETGRRLDALLLGAARDHVGDGPVIVVPPGRLNAVPWALLPSLSGREVSVAPSARSWLRARQATPFGREKVVLVSGPGLDAARAEVGTLAAEYGRATVLAGGDATTARVLGALDGAGLAHIAAHGVFRADSPMFSSLRLADGPMTVHDVERLGRAPYRLILPSCESGRLAPAGADELLGLASALLPLGTAGIVASVAQVGDRAAAPLMLALHRRLRGNASLAAALRGARADVGTDDPELAAAGWSFIALGA